MESKDDGTEYDMDDSDWMVTDEEYENPAFSNYVHADARKVAEDILAEWNKDNNGGDRMVLLKAQMQCGKTSIIRHLCYLLNCKRHCEDLDISNDSTFVLTHLVDNELVRQTTSRLEGVMIDPVYNVFHPAKRALNHESDENVLDTLACNRVLICDESHYGTGLSTKKANKSNNNSTEQPGRIDMMCKSINSPLWYDKQLMIDNNTYVVLISATPFAELVSSVYYIIHFLFNYKLYTGC